MQITYYDIRRINIHIPFYGNKPRVQVNQVYVHYIVIYSTIKLS